MQLSETDLAQTLTFYKTGPHFKMPPAVTDPVLRRSIHAQLPKFNIIEDPKVEKALRETLDPVLAFYGRAHVYDLVVIDSPVPLMMSDTGVVLVVSTGMIRRVESDDELLGYTAHEVAHEYYAKYSIYSRHLLKLITEQGNEPALRCHALKLLALLELQCDAFAALTLISLGYNHLEFVKGMERTARDFPDQTGLHPPDEQRRRIIESLGTQTKSCQRTKAFNALKHLLK